MKIASSKDKHIAINILHTSFLTETFPNSINFVAKQDKRRSKRIFYLMKYQCNIALLFGKIFISNNHKSCILILDSEKRKTTLKTIFWDIELAIRCIGVRNISKVIKREQILKKNHPTVPFLHLWIMATFPKNRNSGIGTKLLKDVLKYYGNEKPIYLETTTQKNQDFYKKHGFNIYNEIHNLGYPLYFLLKPN